MSAISKRVVREFEEKEFRDEYVASRVKRWIASQIKALRTQPDREWSQAELAQKLETVQANVSRLENPDYGKFTLQTLLDVAAAFDVALQVRFVDHMTFLTSTSDISPDKMTVPSYTSISPVMNRIFLENPRNSALTATVRLYGSSYESTQISEYSKEPISASVSTINPQQVALNA